MQYTAIIKDGGLFIPNVFSDLDDDRAHVVQVTVDMASVRQQLDTDDVPKPAAKAPKKTAKRPAKKTPPAPRAVDTSHQEAAREKALDELEALDDSELSEMLKAYINDGQGSAQIALDNL
ncbi:MULTISPECIES: hypothetical protein [unclassified Psychrobacter]|uniref:hypothetical protein n=1 Tax=unclassified Psychrobacter TaxID=196806 RepID=UPI0018F68261|nr:MULTISPECIES: hypothetical protein [unclassified Psychrobacter]